MSLAKIGVIGGTGLYEIEGMTGIRQVHLETPFGETSDDITVGKLNGTGLAFLPRHGRGHRILPGEIPCRANIYALKCLGVEQIISINSCGSFKEEIRPGELLIPDQVIDQTRDRIRTFFGDGVVAHVSMAEPFCPGLSEILFQSARDAGATVHKGGTYVTIEGPAFSTRAESRLYKAWGADVIGMTIIPEACLAREAEICYASICCVTDYDSWREKEEGVTADVIIGYMQKNLSMAKQIIKLAVGRIKETRDCECGSALKNAIVTTPAVMTLEQKKKFHLLIGKYIE
ncbi:MAG: S-methyl-5'-thioadenosine phosphorylase [Dehalococcoidales bacterium]|jgi:5'-methylthioadenosine phosphorylase|nr:S-methyl-5'-thioadenosine phosphorylase [Dehalococcoidales bacterium]